MTTQNTEQKTVFRASFGNVSAYGETPLEACENFFSQFPSKRKCNVIAGSRDGKFFTVTYGLRSAGQWPFSVDGVTRRNMKEIFKTAAADVLEKSV